MMVIVQLFAADQDAPRKNVGRCVGAIVVTVAPVVADAVDHAGSHDRDPHHLHGPDGQADDAEQRDVNDQLQHHALPAETGVQVAFDPVGRRAMAVFFHGFQVL